MPQRPIRSLACAAAFALAVSFSSNPSAHAAPVWQRATPPGGPLAAVAEAPSAPNVLYAVAQNGRVYRSMSNGSTWLRRALLPLGVDALYVSPQNFFRVYARGSQRLFRSTNGGHTWKDLGATASLALDPARFGVVYAGNAQGLFLSLDHADSFVPLAFSGRLVAAVGIDPHAPSTLYAIVYKPGEPSSWTVWKSLDEGQNWSDTGLQVTPTSFEGKLPRIVFDPDHPGTLYVAFTAGERLDPIFRTSDAGATWTSFAPNLGLVDLVATTGGKLVGAGPFGTSRSLDGGLSWQPPLPTAPTVPSQPRDTLTQLAPSRVPEKVLAAGATGFWFSPNAGAAWTASNQGIFAQGIASIAAAPTGPSAIYATTDRAVFRSLDSGQSWTLRALERPGEAPAHLEAIPPESPTTLYATGFDGVATFLTRSTNGGRDWSILPVPFNCNGGSSICDVDMHVVGLDPRNPDAVYVAGHYFFHLSGMGDFLLKSDDGFATYDTLAPLHRLGAVLADPRRAGTLLGITCDGLRKSTDGGEHWLSEGRGLPDSLCPDDESLPVMTRDPADPAKLYVGTRNRGVFTSGDSGRTFRPMNRGLETAAIGAIVVDPEDPTKLYAGVDGRGVFIWNAAAQRWMPLNMGLPLGARGNLALDPQNPNHLYSATALGVYRLDLSEE